MHQPARSLRLMVVGLIIAMGSFGCVNATFVKGVDAPVSVIAPEYRAYVTNDPSLDATAKRIKLRTLDQLLSLISEAKK